jgi:hypothetical protein
MIKISKLIKVSTIFRVIASFCAIGGTIFNLLTILALLNHKPTRRHATTPFVISLATSGLNFTNILSNFFFFGTLLANLTQGLNFTNI